jgi:hypothetical protein
VGSAPDPGWLRLGLAGLARAHEANESNHGHYGAGLIAAYFFCEEHLGDDLARAGLAAQVDRFIANNIVYFGPAGEARAPSAVCEERVLSALDGNIDRFCALGHNVIFAALALKALRRLGRGPDAAESAAIGGLVTDLSFPLATAMEVDVSHLTLESMPAYADSREMALTALREMPRFVQVYRGPFNGWVGHVLTLAHALIELERLGHRDLARRGFRPHRQMVAHAGTLHRYHGTGLERCAPSPHPPTTAAFWSGEFSRNNWAYAHIFKYPLAYFDMARQLTDPAERERVDAAVARLWNAAG